jgi:nucleotide-binding universal stress UspA family protein
MFTVLLPIDENEELSHRAAEFVTDIPSTTDELSVVVLNVFEEFNAADGMGKVDSADLFDEDDLPENVEVLVEFLQEHGIDTVGRFEHGTPADVIVNVADEIDANTIVMGGRRRSPVGKAIFGSVSQQVLLSADRPVTVLVE